MRVNFDITQSLLELSELEITTPEKVGTTLLSSSMIDERRKLLQRGLNLEDAATTLQNFLKENGRSASSSKASISSDTAIDLTLNESTSSIASVSDLSEISTGSFTINGVDFQVDTTSDSLEDIMSKINTANAGVKASFDFSKGELSIQSLRNKPMLILNGSSNFLTATNLKEGFIVADKSETLKNFLESDSLQTRFSKFTSRFNRLMNIDFETARVRAFKSNVDNLLRTGVESHFGEIFNSGTLRLGSNVELTLNSEHTKFTKSKIAFNSDDTPSNFFHFLESANGILGALSSLSGGESKSLIENISLNSNVGLIIQKKI